MKSKFYTTIIIAACCILNGLHAQTNTFPSTGNAGIGTTMPLASAALEMKSTSKGLLIPRMTKTQRDAVLVSTAAKGLLIYQTNSTPGFYYYDGSAWKAVSSKGANTALSNLATTAIDSSLLPGINNSISLGSSSLRWKDMNLYNLKFSNGTIQTTAFIPYTAGTGISISGTTITNTGNGANISLSNLAATSVNQSLIPWSNNAVDIGSSAKSWRNAYLAGTLTAMSVTATSTAPAAAISGTGLHWGVYGFSQDSVGVVGASNGTINSYGVIGTNPNYIGVYGIGGLYGVSGQSSNGDGVKGVSDEGFGVSGESNNSYGVEGSSSNGYGVYGYSSSAFGVEGYTNNSASYACYFQGNVYSTGSYQSSDKILKQNIRDFTSAMGIINKLHPTQYEFRQDGNYKLMMLPAGSHYGLIAQDVEKVLPNLIKQTKFDPAMAMPRKPGEKNISKDSAKSDVINFKALNYTELIPIMIKGMQELSSQNDSLKNEIAVQQQINDNLETRLTKLESMMNVSSASINTQQLIVISSASLEQNIPNPFTHTTSIGYTLPQKFSQAQIVITDKNGKTLKAINVSGSGKGSLNVDASTLSSGAYQYSLVIDGRLIATKQMVLAK